VRHPVQNSRYKDGTTKACSILLSVVPYRALQCDRCQRPFMAVTGVQKLSRERQITGLGSSHRVQASLSKGGWLSKGVHGQGVVVPTFGKSETSRKPPF
jgi:hypothetical protein